MDRIAQGRTATLSVTFTVDGTATDPSPDTATVTILKADGTTLQASTAATEAGTGKFTYTLTPAQTADLDILEVRWTATLGSQAQTVKTFVEVVGGFLFSITDARTVKPLDDTTTYTAAKIAAARTLAETVLEDECGIAFVPRFSYETLSGDGGVHLRLGRRAIRSVRSASVDGTALTVSELDDVIAYTPRSLYYTTGWTQGFSNVSVGYEHGMDYPPPDISRACLLLAKHYLVSSPIDDRVTTMTNEDGTFSLVTPGVRGAVTGLPEVNATIGRYAWPDLVG